MLMIISVLMTILFIIISPWMITVMFLNTMRANDYINSENKEYDNNHSIGKLPWPWLIINEIKCDHGNDNHFSIMDTLIVVVIITMKASVSFITIITAIFIIISSTSFSRPSILFLWFMICIVNHITNNISKIINDIDGNSNHTIYYHYHQRYKHYQ